MRRRRRAPKEIAFSFDSFLDLVANVVGIILRLILVAWVGARAYKGIVHPPLPPPPAAVAEPESLADPTDPRLGQLAKGREDLRHRREFMSRQEAEQLDAAETAERIRLDLKALAERRRQLQADEDAVHKSASDREKSAKLVSLSLEDLRSRSEALSAEMEKLK